MVVDREAAVGVATEVRKRGYEDPLKPVEKGLGFRLRDGTRTRQKTRRNALT